MLMSTISGVKRQGIVLALLLICCGTFEKALNPSEGNLGLIAIAPRNRLWEGDLQIEYLLGRAPENDTYTEVREEVLGGGRIER